MHTSHDKDLEFRKQKWNDHFENKRVIMHDNTNAGLPTASDADQQRSLYSDYYAECCAKGVLRFNFVGGPVESIITGNIDDTKYEDISETFQR
jgi:hypothetical protein